MIGTDCIGSCKSIRSQPQWPLSTFGLYYTPSPPEGGYTDLPLSVLPSVQDIFHRIFLNNYWWQKSDIWSQASYRYPISVFGPIRFLLLVCLKFDIQVKLTTSFYIRTLFKVWFIQESVLFSIWFRFIVSFTVVYCKNMYMYHHLISQRTYWYSSFVDLTVHERFS
jgi:hypothetical protein